jgi:shikimate kinase
LQTPTSGIHSIFVPNFSVEQRAVQSGKQRQLGRCCCTLRELRIHNLSTVKWSSKLRRSIMNIVLIGLRASGKTTIGRLLAQRLDLPFVDLDDRALATFEQKSIRDVWIERGENAWRNAEAASLQELLQADGQIVALGGGTPMIAEVQSRLQACREARLAHVVYLKCSVAELTRRLSSDPGDRPSLTASGLTSEIASVLAQREPTYLGLADIQYDTSGVSPEKAADDLRIAVSRPATSEG